MAEGSPARRRLAFAVAVSPRSVDWLAPPVKTNVPPASVMAAPRPRLLAGPPTSETVANSTVRPAPSERLPENVFAPRSRSTADVVVQPAGLSTRLRAPPVSPMTASRTTVEPPAKKLSAPLLAKVIGPVKLATVLATSERYTRASAGPPGPPRVSAPVKFTVKGAATVPETLSRFSSP